MLSITSSRARPNMNGEVALDMRMDLRHQLDSGMNIGEPSRTYLSRMRMVAAWTAWYIQQDFVIKVFYNENKNYV